MQYLIGIDIGTSATKTVLFDEECRVIVSASEEYPLYQPQNGWAEQRPEDWKHAVLATLTEVLKKSGVKGQDVKGIGLSGQMHGLVMLDENNEVIRPAIIWCDGRTGKECDEIYERVGRERLIQITANPALTGFTASKILWVRNHEPENYARCKHILLPKDYIRFVLTGVFATEVSDASGMQLLDVPKRQWSEEILQKLDIDPALLAKVYESPEVTGEVLPTVAAQTGLAAGTPVVGGAADNAAAAVGTGIVTDGSAFTTIGTSGVVYAHTSKVSIDPKGRVHTFCCAVPGCWLVLGCTLAAGLSLSWFRNNFCQEEVATAKGMGVGAYYLMDQEAKNVPIGANRLLYLPYLMGERSPLLDPDCRGAFIGLSGIHTKRDLLRAVMEGVTYSLRDCYEVLQEMGVHIDEMMACGGGGTSPLWRQMLADVYNCQVNTVQSEGPALGVAILAGVGVGMYPSVPEACKRFLSKDKTCEPIPENVPQYEHFYRIYSKLYGNLKDSFHLLAQ
ncbi:MULTISPECIES: xylulokinase [Caproicibacterium]|uniref:Xylulose kinase n=1 Tax=Caproicibacterium argilliputei TaxID=3030016 RepID=A0AA97D992_9FIRM|nr:xylulokinase [Caproicibacterium argilliputei]WOC32945.1 xylulokinase [Caproicibacterium argilliputei]